MENYTIEISTREQAGKASSGKSELGKAGAQRCRTTGFIPGIAYHRGEQSLAIKVPYKEFVRLAEKAKKSQVFLLKSANSALNGKPAIVKDIQKDYLSNKLLHIDFQTLKENEEIVVDVMLSFVGEAPGVKNDGGILSVAAHEIQVRCLPRNIPDSIPVDISNLELGSSIHAGDLKLPQGVVLTGSDADEETIVSVVSPKSTEPTSVQPAEGEAGAEGTPAAAAAAATSDSKEKK